MNNNKIVNPSDLLQSTLPDWIRSPENILNEGITTTLDGTQLRRETYKSQNHKNFVNFMEKATESNERSGYSQDLLQNLLKYRDFDTYKNEIVKYNFLEADTDEVNEDELTLVDTYGFPDENGVVLVNGEVILYRRKEGKNLVDLQRGCSATKVLPTFRDNGEYIQSVPDTHIKGSRVDNLSVLHLTGFLDIIHKTYAVNIDSDRVVPEVNRSSLLQNISDFFRSKGSKLGIKALFKFLFNTTDVDVFYPGDRMIKPSESTWTESLIMRTVPLPRVFCDPDEVYTTPEQAMGSKVLFKSYTSEDEYAETYCEYVSVYQYKSETQYELVLNKHDFIGEIINNPSSVLTRSLSGLQSSDGRRDYDTITVQSTLGFPDQGVVFIDQEAIYYNRKTPNQFLGCSRGHIGVEAEHTQGSIVYGPYYVETRLIDKDGVERVSRSWPKGIVEAVDVIDPGLLNDRFDKVDLGINGIFDPRDQVLCTIKKELNYNTFSINDNKLMLDDKSLLRLSGYQPFVEFVPSQLNDTIQVTFLENYEDNLVIQDSVALLDGYLTYKGNRTHGVDSIYFDDEYAFVSSSGLPSYSFGDFNKNNACIVGRQLEDENILAVIPRRNTIKDNFVEDDRYIFEFKGTDIIGVFIDGVRAYSNVSPEQVTQGTVGTFDVEEMGHGYINPTVLVDGQLGIASAVVKNGRIDDVKLESVKNYSYNPVVEVTGGKGALLEPVLDRYGRITKINVSMAGYYYYDVPEVQAVDATGKGKGALLKANVSDGGIVSVDIISSGIDFDQKATDIIVRPVGEGAVVKAVTQYYEVNRPVEIENKRCGTSDDTWKFDQGNGFLYERPGFTGPIDNMSKTTFGYTQDPVLLRPNDDGQGHSPLIGWAFDGNPIYGPYGYTNKKDVTGGIERQQSAYRLRSSRNNIIPARSKVIGTDPPLVSEYPMGYFVQDFVYNPFNTPEDPTDDIALLNTESPIYINTEDEKYIEIEFRNSPPEDVPSNLLDINNGKICNTPEFPSSLYPDGVYCYFITIDEDKKPEFPYVIGKTFNNRPISQNINVRTKRTLSALPRQTIYSSMMYDDTLLEFDFSKVERLRNVYDKVNQQEIKLEIGRTSEGYLNDVIIQDNKTLNRIVGDYVYFDNEGTSGAGASATVSRIEGKETINGSGVISNVEVISHHFVIDISNNYNEDTEQVITYTLNKDYVADSYGRDSHSILKVLNYDYEGGLIFVEALSPELPQEGFKMFDQRREPIIFGEVEVLPVPAEYNILWVTSDKEIEPGEILVLDNGISEDYIRDELIKVESIMGNGSIKVIRDYETNTNHDIDDGTMLTVNNKFVFEVNTKEPHMLFGGDKVFFYNDDQFDPDQPYEVNLTLSNNSFYVYTDELKKASTSVKYATSSNNATGYVAGIQLDSAGYGYSSLPTVKGIYNAFIDRAIVYPNMTGKRITSYTIDDGGFRYTDVEVCIVDITNNGTGAKATAVIDDETGAILEVNVEEEGDNYVEPIVYILEKGGKYIPTTDNIGKIESINVINPGRDLGVEGNKRPEVITPTRVVVKYIDGDDFEPGQDVYQGASDLLTATGVIEYYNSDSQLLVLKNVTGTITTDEFLYNIYGTKAEVLIEGDSHCMLKVNGTSTPQGYFVDDTSVISSDYAVIQDSYRYQWFSYVIASNIQKVEYDTFVESIIHPAGFVKFGDLTLRSSVQSTFRIPHSRDGKNNEDLGARPLPPLDPCRDNDTILLVGDINDMPILAGTDNGYEWLNISTGECTNLGDPCSPRWLLEGSEIADLITASGPDGDEDLIVDHCNPEDK